METKEQVMKHGDLKPCPLCGGEAEANTDWLGGEMILAPRREDLPGIEWTRPGCLSCRFNTSYDHWQSLPRLSDAARDVVRELREALCSKCDGDGCDDCEETGLHGASGLFVRDVASRLEQAAPGMGKVWVRGGPTGSSKAYVSQKDCPNDGKGYISILVHGAPTEEKCASDGCPSGKPPRWCDDCWDLAAKDAGDQCRRANRAEHDLAEVIASPEEVWVAEYPLSTHGRGTYTPAVWAHNPANSEMIWRKVPVHGTPQPKAETPRFAQAENLASEIREVLETNEDDTIGNRRPLLIRIVRLLDNLMLPQPKAEGLADKLEGK